jgi:hypothetical protein
LTSVRGSFEHEFATRADVPASVPVGRPATLWNTRRVTFVRHDDGPLAVLTLDHGDLNLFDRGVFASLAEHVDALTADPPRGLLITAAGRMVSAGVDVHEFEGLTPATAERRRSSTRGTQRSRRACTRKEPNRPRPFGVPSDVTPSATGHAEPPELRWTLAHHAWERHRKRS